MCIDRAMFFTLTRLHDEEATLLQPTIDNKDGGLHVALRGFNYEVGYHNIRETSVFVLNPAAKEYDTHTVPGETYTLDQLARYLSKYIPALAVRVNKNGIAIINIEDDFAVSLKEDLRQILGIDERLLRGGAEYVGRRPARLPPAHKWLYIYLDQLSTSFNFIDGAPSSLLAIVPASADAGSIVNVDLHNPMYKKLQVGDIHQLNLRVLNERGDIVDNNAKPMPAVLEIRHVRHGDSN